MIPYKYTNCLPFKKIIKKPATQPTGFGGRKADREGLGEPSPIEWGGGPTKNTRQEGEYFLWSQQDLNLRPTDYESAALTD